MYLGPYFYYLLLHPYFHGLNQSVQLILTPLLVNIGAYLVCGQMVAKPRQYLITFIRSFPWLCYSRSSGIPTPCPCCSSHYLRYFEVCKKKFSGFLGLECFALLCKCTTEYFYSCHWFFWLLTLCAIKNDKIQKHHFCVFILGFDFSSMSPCYSLT